MRGLAAIAWRELVERRVVLAAAVVAAVLPLVAPLLPGASGNGPEARDVTAWAVAALVTVCFGVLLGGSALASDLAHRRLGFYLARPVSALAMWGGKMGAAAGLTMVSAVVILVIPLLLGLHSLPLGATSIGLGWSLLALFGVAGLMVAGAHAASVIWQVRSRWLVLDLVGAVAVGAGAWWAVHRLRVVGADDLVLGLGIAMGVWLLLALLAAGALGTVRGRVEQLRTHRVLSLTLWLLLALGMAGADGYAVWVASPTPADLIAVDHVLPLDESSWVAVAGPLRGRGGMRSAFLVQVANGRWLRMGTGPWGTLPELATTSNGRWAVWSETLGPHTADDVELYRLDLTDSAPRPEPTGVTLRASGWRFAIAVAPDGARVAVVADRSLAVYRLPGGAIDAAVALPEDALSLVRLAWAAPDLVRLWASTKWWYQDGPAKVRIWELVPSMRRLTATGSIPVEGEYHNVQIDVEANRLLLWQRSAQQEVQLTVHDARSGVVLEREEPVSDEPVDERMLSDGRKVVLRIQDGRAVLESGHDALRQIRLGPAAMVRLGGEARPGTVLVGLAPELAPELAVYTTYAVDLDSGEVRAIAEGMVPAANEGRRPSRTAAPGSLATRLLRGDDVLEVWDPATGERTVVAGRP